MPLPLSVLGALFFKLRFCFHLSFRPSFALRQAGIRLAFTHGLLNPPFPYGLAVFQFRAEIAAEVRFLFDPRRRPRSPAVFPPSSARSSQDPAPLGPPFRNGVSDARPTGVTVLSQTSTPVLWAGRIVPRYPTVPSSQQGHLTLIRHGVMDVRLAVPAGAPAASFVVRFSLSRVTDLAGWSLPSPSFDRKTLFRSHSSVEEEGAPWGRGQEGRAVTVGHPPCPIPSSQPNLFWGPASSSRKSLVRQVGAGELVLPLRFPKRINLGLLRAPSRVLPYPAGAAARTHGRIPCAVSQLSFFF